MTIIQLDAEVSKRAIQELDLAFVERRLVRCDGYTVERAREAIDLYRCVLTLMVENSGRAIVPPKGADDALHAHILHTRRYADDMQAIFGGFLHHDPEEVASPSYNEARDFTRQAFLDRFGLTIADFELCTLNFALCTLNFALCTLNTESEKRAA